MLRQPGERDIGAFLARQQARPLSYPEVGASRGPMPRGYAVGRHRATLGIGEAAFERARHALDRWAMFEVGWVRLVPSDVPPRPGLTVAVVAPVGAGLWSLNACRVVDVFDVCDERGGFEVHGFAYGTLADHLERGEERFEVRWERGGDQVAYEVASFSRPAHWLTRLTGPLARRAQARFRRDSGRAMQRAVSP
jgi:uncharacterized protein (UPF0548 family)